MATATKPSYLGTLNAISLAESGAGVYLEAWANATPDEDLASVLRCVAARETSHGDVFCRRISELGFSLMPKADPGSEARLAKVANPKISDLEKIGPERADEKDPFADIEGQMADGIYDPLTAKMMTWYIAEERDSGKQLRDAYASARAKANPASANGHANGSVDTQAIIDCMTAGFARLETALTKIAAKK